MSVRTTNTDGGFFIYDSVTGLAIGEIWDDGEQADRFVEWWNENSAPESLGDMRNASTKLLNDMRKEFTDTEEQENETRSIERMMESSTYGKEEQT